MSEHLGTSRSSQLLCVWVFQLHTLISSILIDLARLSLASVIAIEFVSVCFAA